VHHALRLIGAADQAVEMHEARHIESGDYFGAGAGVVLDSVASHEAGDGFLSDSEGAAEAAALIGPGQLDHFDATQLGEKLAHFIKRGDHLLGGAGEAELTQAVAAHLESDFEGEFAINFDHLGDVGKVLAKLESVIAKMLEARFAVKPMIVMVAHHGNATAGGANHVVVLAEDLEEPFGQGAGRSVATGVSHGLAATSLLLRELDTEAEAPQYAQCSDSNLRIKLVDVAGYEKTDVLHLHSQVLHGTDVLIHQLCELTPGVRGMTVRQ
jgi:hypothetical protein